MEVLLNADKNLVLPEDTFVSLRVGHTQKHARFGPSRTYRFDSVDALKAPIKLEVFKRVGHTTVTMGGTTGNIQDVEVPMKDGTDALQMRLATLKTGVETVSATALKKSKNVNNARGYIAHHSLEELLKDAMKETMNIKPANPHEFLAAYILSVGNGSQSLWVAPDASSPAGSFISKNGRPGMLPPLSASQSLVALPVSKPASVVKEPSPEVEVQTDEVQTVMQLLTEDPEGLTETFRSCTPAQVQAIKASVTSVHEEQEHARVMAEVAAKFLITPNHLRSSVGSWLAPRPKVWPGADTPQYRAVRLRPSVATWYALPPCTEEQLTDPTPYRKWSVRPSVGTWCAVKPHQSLEELTSWSPSAEEAMAMQVILKGRERECKDLSDKLRSVKASLEVAMAQGLPDVAELRATANALEVCVKYAENEYSALAQWGLHRGLSQSPPSSPVRAYRNV